MTDLLQTLSNVKIPYPTEGVIRTASIDDTVSPTNSVELAVNMNFDRVGAVKTRPGVTSYADTLVNGINNYGTLNNFFPDGFTRVAQFGSESVFSDFASFISATKIDSTHIIAFWTGSGLKGFSQVFLVDTTTGSLTALGTALAFEATNDLFNRSIMVDSTHIMNVWRGTANHGYAQIFTFDPITFAVTALSSAFNFDSTTSTQFSISQVDASHFLLFYDGNNDVDGTAVVLAVNLSTWAITKPGSALTFASGTAGYNSAAAIGDGVHFVNFWSGKAQAFSVNLSTWAVTAIGSVLTIDASGATYNSVQSLGDAIHFINFWRDGSGNGKVQVFLVNASTFAVTALSTTLTFATSAFLNASVSLGDGTHFVNFWSTSAVQGYSQVFLVTPSTFAVTATGSPATFGGLSTQGTSIAPVFMSTYRIAALWATKDVNAVDITSVFKVTGDLVKGMLYAQSTDQVYSLTGSTWTSRRSGLAQVSKARFSQYLGYIWMVNGNTTIGGNPVATSNGGAFGTDLVPTGFPQGDFIQAGFEGRVWVFDKTQGIIYYTDIVQFSPPSQYSLTYDADVNFITTIAPQTGQQFTAVKQVPRALLVFTQDNIFRIYGATSLDAYPAYSVGTYSQESIIETKTGIFFHHSSGFYQFDYGSQPVEISRRVIDFVRAIPRANYGNIVGVYDGYDAVEWAVGSVTVGGVVFSSCVMRYTLSTQVWTIYDYVGNNITAMISYDDGTTLNHLMGTFGGLTGAMDTGTTDFGQSFYFEFIDRWRAFTDMYSWIKTISGVNVYSENAAGANVMYQIQKSGVNAWSPLGSVNEENNSLSPNVDTEDFDVIRFRIVGTTRGVPVVIHSIEIIQITVKGFNEN